MGKVTIQQVQRELAKAIKKHDEMTLLLQAIVVGNGNRVTVPMLDVKTVMALEKHERNVVVSVDKNGDMLLFNGRYTPIVDARGGVIESGNDNLPQGGLGAAEDQLPDDENGRGDLRADGGGGEGDEGSGTEHGAGGYTVPDQ